MTDPELSDAPGHPHLADLRERMLAGGAPKYHDSNAEKGKLFARERIRLLVDEGSFVEDGLYANAVAGDLPADGVVTGTATVDGRPVCLMANDSTVKAGSWGARTVEKIIRVIETAYRTGVPMVWLVDSAGARITDQVDMFPGRRGAGRIFWNQVRASGSVPQVCALFGPSAAGGAYIPAFCDVVVMVDGNASMYLGSARMVEMVVGEKTTLEEMGGAKMHCSVSGVGHFLAKDEPEALETVRRYLSYLPSNFSLEPPVTEPADAGKGDLRALVPVSERQAFDMRKYVRALLDDGSFFEIHALWARKAASLLRAKSPSACWKLSIRARSASSLVARMRTANRPALRPPATDTVATGTPAGICTIDSSESRPSRCLSGTGTPMTGSGVTEASIPGRCAAPPAPAMSTRSPRSAALAP